MTVLSVPPRVNSFLSFRVGAGLDGRFGARPALGAVPASQGGSRPLPSVQTRPYPKQENLHPGEIQA